MREEEEEEEFESETLEIKRDEREERRKRVKSYVLAWGWARLEVVLLKIGVPALLVVDYEVKNGETVRYLYRSRHVTTVPSVCVCACDFLPLFTPAFALPYPLLLLSGYICQLPLSRPDQIYCYKKYLKSFFTYNHIVSKLYF